MPQSNYLVRYYGIELSMYTYRFIMPPVGSHLFAPPLFREAACQRLCRQWTKRMRSSKEEETAEKEDEEQLFFSSMFPSASSLSISSHFSSDSILVYLSFFTPSN